MNNKEIIVFTCGDSTKLSTWSNVPFLFTTTLEKKGYIVRRVDVSPNRILNRLFNTISFLLFRRLLKLRACPEFHRTIFHRLIVYRRIRKATRRYKDSSLNLFLTYAFYNKYSDKPNVLWCDWSDRIVIERLNRETQWYEKKSLQHEDRVMKSTDLVFSLFPDAASQMSGYYNREILYLNRNVINNVYVGEFDIEKIIEHKKGSNKILFVGNHRYLGAAKELLQAYKELKEKNSNFELHIIGLTSKQLDYEGEGVFCYGYLHKDIDAESELYYSLMISAKIVVNPARVWGAYSSVIEAMYFGTPIVVAPYKAFTMEFGEDILFGSYLKEYFSLSKTISDVFNSDRYEDMCRSAHNSVKDYTWDNYIDEFLTILKTRNIL